MDRLDEDLRSVVHAFYWELVSGPMLDTALGRTYTWARVVLYRCRDLLEKCLQSRILAIAFGIIGDASAR